MPQSKVDKTILSSNRFFIEHFSFLDYPMSGGGWWMRSRYMEKYLNSMLMHNNTIIEQPIVLKTLAQRLTDKSIEFIEKSAAEQQKMLHHKAQKPFALFHSFTNVHTPLVTSNEFKGKSPRDYGEYGDSVLEMDHQV